jgi:hypothetical protein
MEDANHHAEKRARVEQGSYSDPTRDSERGKGVAKRIKEFASRPLAAIAAELTKRAVALRKGIKAAVQSVGKLEACKAKGEVVTSLHLSRSPALTAILAEQPQLAEDATKVELAAQDAALHKRRQELLDARAELTAIAEGDTFLKAAVAKLKPERLIGLPALCLQEEIMAAAEDFKLCLRLKFLGFEDAEEARAAAAKEKAAQKEKERMEIEQQDTATTVKRLVEEQVRKALAKRKEPAKVSFKPAKGAPSKARDRSASRGRSPKRSQTPHPGKGKGKRGRPPKGGGKTHTPAHSRGRSSSRGSHKASRSRSKSQGNGKGDRGTHPRRPPSGKQGGSGRVGGGGGSKTGQRR